MLEPAATCVIDTSALVGMLAREPDATSMIDALGFYPHRILPPSCIVELCSIRGLNMDMRTWLIDFVDEYEVAVLPMDSTIAWIAADAANRYGRGSGHRAKLNFGDCMSYAYSRYLEAPLLFKGADFVHADIQSALPVPS